MDKEDLEYNCIILYMNNCLLITHKKMKELAQYDTTWTNLEDVMLTKISQPQKR